jgi:hypothetical protein
MLGAQEEEICQCQTPPPSSLVKGQVHSVKEQILGRVSEKEESKEKDGLDQGAATDPEI